MKDIRIYVACNENSYVPKNPLLFAIQTGASDAAERFTNMLYDDTGDNISKLNPGFCELTAQYWAWKNVKADYCGFFHNRRYLSFNEKHFDAVVNGSFLLGNIDDDSLKTLRLDEQSMRAMIEDNDILSVEPVDLLGWTGIGKERSVTSQYAASKQHGKHDLDMAVEIIKERHPDYEKDAKKYLSGSQAYFLNIFIMRKELLDEYCEWLFDILFELDGRFYKSDYSTYEMRQMGFIGERLFGVYLTHLKRTRKEVRIKHLQCGMFSSVENPYPVPAFGKNCVPVAICSSNEYVPFTSVLLWSLAENSSKKNNYDIVIMDNGISDTNKRILNTIGSDYSNISIRYINIQNVFRNKRLPTINNISVSSYGRLTVPGYFCHYPKVVYLDADTVLIGDIADIFPKDLSKFWVAAARDPVSAGWCKMPRNSMRDHVLKDIGLHSPFDYFNAGVMVLNLEALRKVTSSEELFNLAQKGDQWTWMDQDILNFICKDNVKFLGQEWNLMVNANAHSKYEAAIEYAPQWLQDEYSKARQTPKLIHFAGGTNPCYQSGEDFSDVFWGYAKKTPFYEELIRYRSRKPVLETVFPWTVLSGIKKMVMPLLNKVSPRGSRVRTWLTKVYHRLLVWEEN